jgi:ribose-phosphate pyrophosphokinase
MKVVCTEKSQVLSARVAKALKLPLVYSQYKTFPDGELYLKTGDLDKETLLISSTADNTSLVQLLLMIDACEASDTTLVLPYMGYARQDKRFNDGEPVSSRAIARALSAGVSRVITVNIHESTVLSHFRVPAIDISLAPEMAGWVRNLGCEDPLILAPDKGAARFAADIATIGGWETDHLSKTRLSGEEVRIAPSTVDASNRDIVITDDIISTGGTLATAAGMLTAGGARSVHAACVHGVFASGGFTRLASAGLASVAASDTIESAASVYSAAGMIAAAVRK